jgi:hypothetical protein
MSDELKEHNILKLILIVRFACATLDVGHPIYKNIYYRRELLPVMKEECTPQTELIGASTGLLTAGRHHLNNQFTLVLFGIR